MSRLIRVSLGPILFLALLEMHLENHKFINQWYSNLTIKNNLNITFLIILFANYLSNVMEPTKTSFCINLMNSFLFCHSFIKRILLFRKHTMYCVSNFSIIINYTFSHLEIYKDRRLGSATL